MQDITPVETPVSKRSMPSAAKTWYYAGPIITDVVVVICITVGLVLKAVPLDFFKWIVSALVVGNVALRIPGGRNLPNNIPGGGGIVVALVGWLFKQHS